MNNISSCASPISSSITQPINANPTREEIEKEFVEFYKTLQNLEDAAVIFKVAHDTDSEARIKEWKEKLSSFEKETRLSLTTGSAAFRLPLSFWRQVAQIVFNMQQELISRAIQAIHAKSTDRIAAYNMIEGNVAKADTIINFQNQRRANYFAVIGRDMANNHANKIQALARNLLKEEQDFHRFLQQVTAQKIVDIQKKLGQMEIPDPSSSPQLLMAKFEPISSKQMPALLEQTEKLKNSIALAAACEEEFCSRAHSLEISFPSNARTIKPLAEEFIATRKRLDALQNVCSITHSVDELTDTFKTLALSPPTVSPKNDLMLPPDASPPNILSPDPMRASPPSPTSESTKSPDAIAVTAVHVTQAATFIMPSKPLEQTTSCPFTPISIQDPSKGEEKAPTTITLEPFKAAPILDSFFSTNTLQKKPREKAPLSININKAPSSEQEACPTPAWLLTPLQAFKKHAPLPLSLPKKPPQAMIHTSTTLPHALPRNEPSALEQFAKRLCKFMLLVAAQSKHERFISINGKDLLEDEEVAGILTAISNFCGSNEKPANLYTSLLRYLHNGEVRTEIIELFFRNPDPNTSIDELQKKMFMSAADAAKLFSIPEEVVEADCQKQYPVATSIYLGDHHAMWRLAALDMMDAIPLDELSKIQVLCHQILDTWQAISFYQHSLLDVMNDSECDIDLYFEVQKLLLASVQKFEKEQGLIACLIRDIRSSAPSQNKT